MDYYIEYAVGEPRNRGNIIRYDRLKSLYDNNRDKPIYISYFRHDEEMVEHFRIRKTIRNYRGKFYIQRIIFDIDKSTDSSEGVYRRAKAFYENLIEQWKIPYESIGLFFSGTGFHFSIPNIFNFKPSNYLPEIVKNTLCKYFPEADDIYDSGRIIRLVNTINLKSGLYKTQLSEEDLYEGMDYILEKAKEPNILWALSDVAPDFSTLVHDVVHTEEVIENTATNMITCVQNMYDEGDDGNNPKKFRHERLLRIATAWRKAGVPKEAIYHAIASKFKTLEPYEVKRNLDDIFNKNYQQYKCDNWLMQKYCDPKCVFYKMKNYGSDITSVKDVEDSYVEFINTNFGDKVFNMNEIFPWSSSFKFYPAEFVVFNGDTKMGKSCFVQNMCVKLRRFQILYITLEVGKRLMYRRFIQTAHEMTKEQVDAHYLNDTKNLSEAISHIKLSSQSVTLDQLEQVIADNGFDIVVIDTVDGLNVKNVRGVEKDAMIAERLRYFTEKYQKQIWIVHHISKSASEDKDGNQKMMSIHSGKGGSDYEQKADKVIGVSGVRALPYRRIHSTGARDEAQLELPTYFDWNKMIFKEKL